MNNQAVYDALNGARYVRVAEDFVFVWFGGTGIHVHLLPTWKEVEYFEALPHMDNTSNLEEIKKSIEAWILDVTLGHEEAR